MVELKGDHFYGGLPKPLKAMVPYLKAGPQVRTYSDYLRAAREAEKEDSIKLSRNSRIQTADSLSKPRTTSFFPLRKLKSNQPFSKKPAVELAQLEEEDADDGQDPESDDPDGITGVTEEFMIWLARLVKDAQTDEKYCYHYSSPEHFICNCLLMKTARDKKLLNGKEGMAMMKGVWTPSTMTSAIKGNKRRPRKCETTFEDSLLESGPFPVMVQDRKCSKSKDKWQELHGSPRQWCTGEYHHAEVHE